jgi:hypothetical protein
VKSLTVKRAKVLERLRAMGAEQDRILAAVGAAKVDDIDAARLEVLVGLGTAIKDGDTTIEEAFPAPEQKPIFTKPAEDQIPGAEVPATPPPTPPPAPTPTPAAQPAQQPDAQAAATPQQELADLITGAGHTFDEMQKAAMDNGVYRIEFGSFDDLPNATAQKLLRMRSGLLSTIGAAKGDAK